MEYKGCFADDAEDRLLGSAIKLQENMTQDVCRSYCKDYGAPFYATQVRELSSFGGART